MIYKFENVKHNFSTPRNIKKQVEFWGFSKEWVTENQTQQRIILVPR